MTGRPPLFAIGQSTAGPLADSSLIVPVNCRSVSKDEFQKTDPRSRSLRPGRSIGGPMFCVHCGAKIADGSKFCPVCGKSVRAVNPSKRPAPDGAAAKPAPQHPAPQPAPQAPPTFSPAPKPARTRRRAPAVIVGAAAAVLAVLVIGTLLAMFGPFGRTGAPAGDGSVYSDNLDPKKYDLKAPERDLDSAQVFSFGLDDGVDLGLKALDDDPSYRSAQVPDAAKVFVDGSLTTEFPVSVAQVDSDGENRLEIEPAYVSAENLATEDAAEFDDIFHFDSKDTKLDDGFGRWYGFGGYYLVRYIGSDGKKLEKPVVTYFTVKDDVDSSGNALPEPQSVRFAVQGDGGLGISWSPVEGAKRYKVYLRVFDKTKQGDASDLSGRGTGMAYRLLAETDGTEVNTLDYDFWTKRMRESAKAGGFTTYGGHSDILTEQNKQFADLVIGDDEDQVYQNRQDAQKGQQGLAVADYQPNAEHVKSASIAVVACGDDDDAQSPFRFQSINPYLGQIPVKIADNIDIDWIRAAPDGKTDPAGFIRQRLTTYVTMADGTAAAVLNDLDTSKMTTKQSTMTEGEDENDPSTWTKRAYTYAEVPYTVRNTVFSDVISFEGEWFPGGADQIKQVASEQLQEMTKANPATGAPQRAKLDSDIDWNKVQADQKISDTAPEVDYPVNGSSEYVKFVAANIMAGNMAMDVTRFAEKPGAPDFGTVFSEALGQNPLCLLSDVYADYNLRHDGDKTIVSVYDGFTSEHNDAAKMVERRKKVWAEVKKIVDGAVKDGMDEGEKVRAINDAMADRLSYDYDFYYVIEGKFDLVQDPEIKKNPFLVRAATAEELLNRNKAVCSGYAQIFKACADYAGIESVYVTGTVPPEPGRSSNTHAWNLVKDGDAWKVVDVTWDDTGRDAGGHSDEYLMLDQKDAKLAGRTYDRGAMPSSWYDENVDASLLAAA